MKARVFVPGTAANLGPGSGVFVLAVNLHNEFIVEDAEQFEIAFLNGQGDIPATRPLIDR